MNDGCRRCGDARFGLSRRDVLGGSIGGFLGFAMARQTELFGAPAPELLVSQDTLRPKARSIIVLWMAGGPSQFETWDPKPGVTNGGPTRALETSVPGIKYAENMRVCATQAKHIAAIRSMTSKQGSHERARYLLHTGYEVSGTVVHPAMGAVTAMEIGSKSLDLPNFVSINGRSESAGFLSSEYNPLILENAGGGDKGGKGPSVAALIPNIRYPEGVSKDRFRERLAMLEEQEREFEEGRPVDEIVRHRKAYDRADRLMHTPLLEAFDTSKEKAELVKSYGENPFGRGCLLARRLVERGVAFVEVGLGGWDTHQDNFNKVAKNCQQLDPGMGTLIADLDARGMLDETMVVWMGEFGRTPKINDRSGRDHYPRCWSAALAGGGIQGGRVIGASDKDGVEVKERPVTVPDLFSTVYSCLGVDTSKKYMSTLGRPIQVVDKGAPVRELIS
jgi:hypothetical protein